MMMVYYRLTVVVAAKFVDFDLITIKASPDGSEPAVSGVKTGGTSRLKPLL